MNLDHKKPDEVLDYMVGRKLTIEINPQDETKIRFYCYDENPQISDLFYREAWSTSHYNYIGLSYLGYPVACFLS